MRAFVILLASMFVLLGAFSTTASADSDCTKTIVDQDAVLVRASVSYGSGCVDADLERCTLYQDPEYPSHPYWRCEKIL